MHTHIDTWNHVTPSFCVSEIQTELLTLRFSILGSNSVYHLFGLVSVLEFCASQGLTSNRPL